jgi:hypothetical protein
LRGAKRAKRSIFPVWQGWDCFNSLAMTGEKQTQTADKTKNAGAMIRPGVVGSCR